MDSRLVSYPLTASIVKRWNERLKYKNLCYEDFKEYWRLHVPQVFGVGRNLTSLEWVFNEETVQEVLFTVLEDFICGGNSKEVIHKLRYKDDPPSICGKVFKVSEPTYNCRDCAVDPTCVLCVDCFIKSPHRNHKYKVATSSGGGCCDCGDLEAWKADPYCSDHQAAATKSSNTDSILESLPGDMEAKAEAVFKAALRYTCYLLMNSQGPDLPSELKLREIEDPLYYMDSPDTYCTVLYNDETHTFEHVITTLQKVLKCSQKESVDYVTSIDRVGRAVVKCSNFVDCTNLQDEIVRITSRGHSSKPLKVVVTHAHIVSHQIFSLRLLAWLQKTLTYSKHLRRIFSNCIIEKSGKDIPVIKCVMERDSSLWKAARIHWHRLFITGMLMEYENKKKFAIIFTECYGLIMKEFIQDDHDRSVSVASMGVQLYTVPSIAHYLIGSHGALFVLLNTFISECNPNIKNNRLEFQKNDHNAAFKRAQYILYDLHYLLSCVPERWTEELRKGIHEAMFLFVKLFSFMQGADPATRQLGQHMEYEPEWETAFNLHVKIAPIISALLRWCSQDKSVLTKTYRAVLRKLKEDPCEDIDKETEVKLAGHAAKCIVYEVSSQPVSIHLPNTRFFSGICTHLEKFGLSFKSFELTYDYQPTLVQLMEPILRAQVMVAQVNAGLWRRNGYAILHQVYFYSNVKCRAEMLDQDIAFLQMVAALLDPNEFLIHILNKFKLVQWAELDFEDQIFKKSEDDTIRHSIVLVEEFLMLLIAITGERYKVGVGDVTEDECLKKEIIQQLCINPLPHSELNKELSEGMYRETGIERVIEDVAIFKKPAGAAGKGVYELKPEYYDRYNVFYYHYTKEELSKSEEVQRLRRKNLKLLECCPPPPLPGMTKNFQNMPNILLCDVMLHIMKVVLTRAVDLKARSFSEYQLQRVLHLIGYALYEEENQRNPDFKFTERFMKWQLDGLLDDLSKSVRVEAHWDLIKWTLNKFRQVESSTKSSSNNGSPDEKMELVETEKQRGKIEIEEKQRRAKLAAERRAKLMDQMSAMQKTFMKENENMFNAETTATTSTSKDNITSPTEESMEWQDDNCGETKFVAIGPNQTTVTTSKKSQVCMLCQEEEEIKIDGDAMVYVAYIQKSSVLRLCRPTDVCKTEWTDTGYMGSDFPISNYVNTCGHMMHLHCFKRYFSNVMAKENRRPYRFRQPTSYDIEKKEFLCPLCEVLCNTIMPVLPSLNSILTTVKPPPASSNPNSFDSWISSILVVSEQTVVNVPYFLAKRLNKLDDEKAPPPPVDEDQNKASTSGGGTAAAPSEVPVVEQFEDDFDLDEPEQLISGEAEVMEQGTATDFQIVIQKLPIDSESGEILYTNVPQISQSVLDSITNFMSANYKKESKYQFEINEILCCWKCCAYTVHIIERFLRTMNKPVLGDFNSRQVDCVETLIKISAIQEFYRKKQDVNSCAVALLGVIFDKIRKLKTCLLDWDPFTMLVALTMSIPTLYSDDNIPTGSQIIDLYILKFFIAASVAQILIFLEFPDEIFDRRTDNGIPTEARIDTECLIDIWFLLKGLSPTKKDSFYLNTHLLWEEIKIRIQPFMRCCTIFYHFLTGVPAPQCLKEKDGDTYSNMCAYLSIPDTCSYILNDTSIRNVFKSWTENDKFTRIVKNSITYLPMKRLVPLCDDYLDMINSVSNFSCRKSSVDQEDSRNPTMCLVCGEMLCSQSYCCQRVLNGSTVGACAFHAYHCGAGAGIFLRIRECEILLLSYPNRGCFLPPPYIDEYGETDQGLQRGNPMKLCKDRYQVLNNVWLSHGIHAEVSRFIEATHNMTVTQWQHL